MSAPSHSPAAGRGPRGDRRLRRLPAPAPLLRAHRAREEGRPPRRHLLGPARCPGFGDPDARLLLVGLAPAAHGANRTGRVFTGDGSGDFLLRRAARRPASPTSRPRARADDGLALRDAYILSAVRCAPPDNKPTPDEIARCRRHLTAEIAALPRVRVVVALGKIGHDAYLAHVADDARRPPAARAPPSATAARRASAAGCRCCSAATTRAARTPTPAS